MKTVEIMLKGELDGELLSLGLKAGDRLTAEVDPLSTVGCLHFTQHKNGNTYQCSVWPQNYMLWPGRKTTKGGSKPGPRVETFTDRIAKASPSDDGPEFLRCLVRWMDNRNEHLNDGKSALQLVAEFNKYRKQF